MKGKLIKNFSFVFSAQILVLIISIVRALILPKIFSIEEFGYWEVYWFYTCYVGLFALGYNDGIYLQYGECDLKDLPIIKIRSANLVFTCLMILFSGISIGLILIFSSNVDVSFALAFAALNIVIMCLTGVYIYIFQISGKFQDYSFFSIVDKVLVILAILWMAVSNHANFEILVVVDFCCKVLVLLAMIYKLPEIFIGIREDLKSSIKFMIENMNIGIKLMIANIMSMLLIGAGKFIVQIFGGIEDFAIYSFGMSITALVLTCVTAISLVLYPTIKRISIERYKNTFEKVNIFTRLFGFTGILIFFPAFLFIEWFYPKYTSVLAYLNILFIIVFLQCKISILLNTFYKVMRKESLMLKVNITCVLFFCIIAMISYAIWHNMYVIALCTALALLYRCYDSERYFTNLFKIEKRTGIIVELSFLILFFLSTQFLSLNSSIILMGIIYVGWLIIRREENLSTLKTLLKQ